MIKNVQIAFDLENSKEYFQLYVPEEISKENIPENKKDKTFYRFKKQTIERPLGKTMLEFLNLNLNDMEQMDYFIYVYTFINYLTYNYPLLYKTLEYYKDTNFVPKDETYEIIMSVEEIETYANILKLKYGSDFKDAQFAFQEIIDGKYFKILYETAQKSDPNYEKIEKYRDCEDYEIILNDMSSNFKDIKINFDLENFFFGNIPKNINVPNYYSSDDTFCIIYITLRELLKIRKNFKIQRCKLCNEYFIPRTGHTTAYCDNIYLNNKTCKEYANSQNATKQYKNDPHLQKYRKRYQNLSKQARESNSSTSSDLFEKYKIEGAKMKQAYLDGKIDGEKLDAWVNNMKIRK